MVVVGSIPFSTVSVLSAPKHRQCRLRKLRGGEGDEAVVGGEHQANALEKRKARHLMLSLEIHPEAHFPFYHLEEPLHPYTTHDMIIQLALF